LTKLTALAARIRFTWDVALLVGMGLSLMALLAVISRREAERPLPPPELAAVPTPEATATATPGWWDHVTMTPPALAALPGVPTVALSAKAGVKQGAPIQFKVLSCPRSDVKIEDVTGGQTRGWWNLYGTAAIANQWYWKGEISPDGRSWQMLYRSEAPVQGGLLIEFNTRTVPGGAYQVRLTAVDRTGNYPDPCVIEVTTE
jgi:hypothetical protein